LLGRNFHLRMTVQRTKRPPTQAAMTPSTVNVVLAAAATGFVLFSSVLEAAAAEVVSVAVT
jgi:hypothetical protein